MTDVPCETGRNDGGGVGGRDRDSCHDHEPGPDRSGPTVRRAGVRRTTSRLWPVQPALQAAQACWHPAPCAVPCRPPVGTGEEDRCVLGVDGLDEQARVGLHQRSGPDPLGPQSGLRAALRPDPRGRRDPASLRQSRMRAPRPSRPAGPLPAGPLKRRQPPRCRERSTRTPPPIGGTARRSLGILPNGQQP
jgi:hypothetical protein